MRSRLATQLGPARLEQLEPGYPVTGYTSLPGGAAEAVRMALAAKGLAGGAEGAGSNSWVLSGDRTTTGRTAARQRPAPAAGGAVHLVRRRPRSGTASAAPA